MFIVYDKTNNVLIKGRSEQSFTKYLKIVAAL